jgi:T-complex protein 1 subunit theta
MFLAGAGACDIELARLLKDFGAKSTGLEQYAIKKFAEALEVVPITLAENAGLKANNIISQLYAAHEKGLTNVGVDIEAEGRTVDLQPAATPGVRAQRKQKPQTSLGVRDCVGIGILDLLSTKEQALKLALDVALTILRVDQVVRAKQAGGPKMRQQGHWDDTD